MSWRHSHKIPLIAVCTLAVFVLVRLCLMTYWSLGSADSYSSARLSLYWILALIVLAMLFRFAWQIWTGRHQTRWDAEQR